MVVIACSLCAAPAQAGPGHAACLQAADDGQRLRDEGKLFDSRAAFARCIRPECPPIVAKECAAWLEELATRQPSIIVVLEDALGHDVGTARVLVDGVLHEEAVAGRMIALDPGPHVVRAESNLGSAETAVILRERDQGRRLVIRFAAPAQDHVRPAPKVTRPVPLLTYALGGVSVSAAGVGTYFAVGAASQYSDLSRRCPACSDGERTNLRSTALAADTFLGLAAATALGAIVIYLMRPSSTAASQALVSF